MPTNVEIKARISDPERLRATLEEITGNTGELLVQEDVFFRVQTGRLKLRIFDEQRGELIAYQRRDQTGPKLSEYAITPTRNPANARHLLENLLGVIGVVRKHRLLFLIGATRVHLDRVEGLGDFLELEVVLQDGENAEAGTIIAQRLMERLEIEEKCLIGRAYIDLLSG
jgi:predicted adenylyl cyclase CyaB